MDEIINSALIAPSTPSWSPMATRAGGFDRRLLLVAEFKVVEAATGLQVLAFANEGVSAVVLDVRLPEMNGFDLGQAVRARPETATLPVMAATRSGMVSRQTRSSGGS